MGLSDKQKKIFAFPGTIYDALICDGSIRSGKTVWMTVAFIDDGMHRYSGKRFGICGKTVDSAVKNVIDPYIASGIYKDFGFRLKWKRTEKVLEVRKGNKINLFEVFGGKDESSYTLIQGRTLAGVLLDEVALMPRSFVEQALARCSVEGSKLWFNCNPGGQLHWFNQEWVLKPEEHNALHLHFTMDDNPALSQAIRARYETMYTGVFYDRYIRGLWVAAEGLIYDMFDPVRHVADAMPEDDGLYYVSADFGIQNATTFLLWAHQKGADRWLCLKEYYYSGREKRRQVTVSELVQGLKTMLDGIWPYRVIIDPSAAALDVELRKNGFSTMGADNDVINGISDVSTMLQGDKLLFSSACKHTIDEFGVYCWDEKAADNGIDRPVKENDHCLTGETMVDTENGAKPISELVGTSGMVWSYNVESKKAELKPYHDCRLTQEKAEIYEIETEDGRFIRCTGEHPILTKRGYVSAKELLESDKIIDIVAEISYVGIKAIRKLGKADVYNMEVDETHNFSVEGGLIVHNCMDAVRYFVRTRRLVKRMG